MFFYVRAIFRTEALARFRSSLAADIAGGGNGPLGRALTGSIAAKYFEFARRRFDRNSGGGGEWPPLAPLTKRLRADGGAGGILRVTRTLQGALTPGGRANLIRRIRGGVRVGIAGGGKHPDASVSVGELAAIHHAGGGSLPSRQIIVKPDAQAVKAIVGEVVTAVRETARRAGGTVL